MSRKSRPINPKLQHLIDLATEHGLDNPRGRAAAVFNRMQNHSVIGVLIDRLPAVARRLNAAAIAARTTEVMDNARLGRMRAVRSSTAAKWLRQLDAGYPLKRTILNDDELSEYRAYQKRIKRKSRRSQSSLLAFSPPTVVRAPEQ